MVTLAAWSPFGPSTTSNSTCAPSARERKPLALIALKCTKTSSPELVVMKPKPFASLNHLTVPLLRIRESPCSLFVLHSWRFRSSASRTSQPQTSQETGGGGGSFPNPGEASGERGAASGGKHPARGT